MITKQLRVHLPDPRTGLEPMDHDDCMRLLAEHQNGVGRIAFVDDGTPVILPVNYAMVENRIVFRTALGSKFDAARRGERVGFEIDHVDSERRTGWSVLVKGRADAVTGQQQLAMLRSVGLAPFAESEKAHWVMIEPDSVTGYRLPFGGRFFY